MDAGDGPWADVVGQVAEYDAIHECGPEVFMEGHFQPHLDALGGGKQKEPVAMGTEASSVLNTAGCMNWSTILKGKGKDSGGREAALSVKGLQGPKPDTRIQRVYACNSSNREVKSGGSLRLPSQPA